MLIIPFRFLTVNAVVRVNSPTKNMQGAGETMTTDGIYDGVLMKLTDLSYVDLQGYIGQSLASLETLSAHGEGPKPITDEITHVNQLDWKVPFATANRYFFSDLDDWKIIAADDREKQSGFYAVAYERGNTVVIAYRGTVNVQDLVADAEIYLSVPDMVAQLTPAKEFMTTVAKQLQGRHIQVILTGHSMGGWLAQKVYTAESGKLSNWNIVGSTVFNSIGTGFHPSLAQASLVKDYHFQGDVFSDYGSSLGAEIVIPNQMPGESVYDRHQMYDFYKYFYPSAVRATTGLAHTNP